MLPHSVLWYIEKGECQIVLNDHKYEGKAGRLYFFAPQSTLSCTVDSADITIWSINFSADISFLPDRRIWSSILNFTVDYPFRMEPIIPIYHEIRRLSDEYSVGQKWLLQAEMDKLFAQLLNQYFKDGASSADFIKDARIQTVVEYLAAYPEAMPSIEQLSELVHLGASQLRKLFYQCTGLSPLNYMYQYKMKQAKQLLLMSEEQVADIGYRVGFADPNYFSRKFKQIEGVTPREYRSQNMLID
jgi:AraC-like DNA-binding protein